jgi:hypothetical protein
VTRVERGRGEDAQKMIIVVDFESEELIEKI